MVASRLKECYKTGPYAWLLKKPKANQFFDYQGDSYQIIPLQLALQIKKPKIILKSIPKGIKTLSPFDNLSYY